MHNKNIELLYGFWALSLILSCIPKTIASLLGLIILTVTLTMAYKIRKKASAEDKFTQSHATHIIRTIWIGSLLGIVSLIIGGIYMYLFIDNEPLMPCMTRFVQIAPTFNPEQFNQTVLMEIFASCIPAYIKINTATLITTIIIMLGPILLYFIYRYGLGLISVLKKKGIQAPKKWL